MRTVTLASLLVVTALVLGSAGVYLDLFESDTPEVTLENNDNTTHRIIVYTITDYSPDSVVPDLPGMNLLVTRDGEYQRLDRPDPPMISEYHNLTVADHEDVTRRQYILEPNSETTTTVDEWEEDDVILYVVKTDEKVYTRLVRSDKTHYSFRVTIDGQNAFSSGVEH